MAGEPLLCALQENGCGVPPQRALGERPSSPSSARSKRTAGEPLLHDSVKIDDDDRRSLEDLFISNVFEGTEGIIPYLEKSSIGCLLERVLRR
jgi:hypothetical protein